MTLILKLNLDMVEMYLHTKKKFLCQETQKLYPEQTETQTDTHTDMTENITYPDTRVLKMGTIPILSYVRYR